MQFNTERVKATLDDLRPDMLAAVNSVFPLLATMEAEVKQVLGDGYFSLALIVAVLAAWGAIDLVAELRYQEAAGLLHGLVPRLEGGDDRPAAGEGNFWLGYCHEKLEQTPQAAERYRRVLRNYGDTPAARMARQRLSDLPSE